MVSELWRNEKWTKQKLRSDLAPISVSSREVIWTLHRIAKLTPVDKSEPKPDGYPPKVLKAIRQALSMKESAGSRTSAPPSGWAQRIVLPKALLILQGLLKSEKTSTSLSVPQATLPASLSPAQVASSSDPHSNVNPSNPEPSLESTLSNLKKNLKRKLSDSEGDKINETQERIQEIEVVVGGDCDRGGHGG